MAKKTDTIDRTIEFWRTRRNRKFLLTQKTIDLLRQSIKVLNSRKLTLKHIQALNLAVSLFESQMRDCLRLAIDEPYSTVNPNSEFLKIQIDFSLFENMRSRLLTLGEFVSINNNISNVSRLWNAVFFCFPFFDEQCVDEFRVWCEKNGRHPYQFFEIKSSIAWVYTERNKYVHEFFDEAALTLGGPVSSSFAARLGHAYDFLAYVQSLKEQRFSDEVDEDHPVRGEVGKKINRINKKIKKLVARFEELLALQLSYDGDYEDYPDSVRASLSDLLTRSKEYVAARSEFAYVTFGPGGTIRNDIAAVEHLDSLNELYSVLTKGLENVSGHFDNYPEDNAETAP